MESKFIKTSIMYVSKLGFSTPAILVDIKTDNRCLGNQRVKIVYLCGKSKLTPIRNIRFV
jgi:hypothetical protein